MLILIKLSHLSGHVAENKAFIPRRVPRRPFFGTALGYHTVRFCRRRQWIKRGN